MVETLTSAEEHRKLDPIALFQETLGTFEFDVFVVGIGLGAEPDLFDLLLVVPLLLLLGLVVLVLAVIHDSADGRALVGGNLHEVHSRIAA